MADDLRPTNSRTGERQDTPLVDDLAFVLASMVVGWENIIGHDLAEHPEVVRVMARYRAWKGERQAMVRETLDEHAETLRRLGE